MKRPTKKDVARFVSGEIADAEEAAWISDAIHSDPLVASWYAILDMENLMPAESDGGDASPGMAAFQSLVAQQLKDLPLTELWHVSDRDPKSLFNAASDVQVSRFNQDSGAFETATLSGAMRSAGDPTRYEFKQGQWLSGYRPLGFRLVKLQVRQFAPLVKEFQLRSVRLAPKSAEDDSNSLRRPDRVLQPSSLAADDRASHRHAVDAQSSDLVWTYHEGHSRLEVTATLPTGAEGETVVAELRHTDEQGRPQVQRRMVQLDFQLDDGRWKGSTRFRKPAVVGSDRATITVRPVTADDVPMLEGDDVAAFLARQTFVAIPIEETIDAYQFRLRFDDQKQAASDPETCWLLAVAAPGKEG